MILVLFNLLIVLCGISVLQLKHPAGSSNDSDKCDSVQRFGHDILRYITMAVYEIFFFFIFQVNLRNQERVYQHNITEKYYKIGRSELC